MKISANVNKLQETLEELDTARKRKLSEERKKEEEKNNVFKQSRAIRTNQAKLKQVELELKKEGSKELKSLNLPKYDHAKN